MPVATKERKAKATKKVQLIARYALKRNAAIVVYTVRSSDGSEIYQTTLYEGKATGCSCKATSQCYHKTQIEMIESKRVEEMCEAIALAPIIVGEQFAQDMEQHIEDEVAVFDVEPIQLVTGSCNSCGNPTKRAFCAGCAGVAA